ncbi:apoptotic protease-activating factor 1-like isoform X2 [Leptopilina heterotoma]|uniref:apoptotic protease-activating factor 1-like isoform X2 n=1 Tax=Leptopilina heterotoma TaxID=63436 RepID=UPI001CA9B647|nr:apoptotic protease-activating factor 1-like isoform X2 [Leptopilina heterotoma]
MEEIHCDILKKYRKAIVDDVDVNNEIIKPLRKENILTDDDVKRITNGTTLQERASILLELLPLCGPSAFDAFNQALKHHYCWISTQMEKHLEWNRLSLCAASHCNDLPPVPRLLVTREDKFKQDLQKLKPGKHLALHGLKGFGKTSLIVITLKDDNLVANLFRNEVYCLKFSYSNNKQQNRETIDERKIDEEILIQLNVLYQRIKKSETLPTPLKSEPLKECLIRLIKLHFCLRQHENALLILEDVCCKKIVDTFNFCCKTLVITDDLSVVKHKHPIIFKVHDGFTETESLCLFAKVLNVSVEQLPPEAKKIHEECKGMPLLISMFSAQFEDFKEQLIVDRARWKYYLKCLRKREPDHRAIQKRTTIFDMCIDKLSPELKELYFELSIFSEGVNIMPKTLEILWGLESFDVDELMLTLCNKSLAARQWNADLKNYVYGIHDLLLSHLRMKLSPEIMTEKHRSFIKKYQNVCNNDFSKLPNDNYGYSYIGHHLEQAKLYDSFEKIYLNLEFIQAKIINAGLNDLLIDLEKYEQYISRDYKDDLVQKIIDIEKFLKDHMSIFTKHGIRNCLDIVQIALYHAEEGFVLDQARELAGKRALNLYLSRTKIFGQGNVSSSENLSTESTIDSFLEDVSTICFTNDDPHSLLIATKNGDIVDKNLAIKKSNYIYGFQKKKIVLLVLSHLSNCFLALSDEGKAKLFSLNDEESSDDGRIVQSPREKQNCWTGFFTNKLTQDDSLHTFWIEDDPISDITFSPKDEFIAACTPKGTIQVWMRNGEQFQTLTVKNNCCLKKIAFTSDQHNNILLHVMDENQCVLITHEFVNNTFKYKSTYNPQICQRKENMKIVFFKGLPFENNSLILVTKNKAVHIKWLQSETQIHSFIKQEKAEIEDPNTFFICATVTYDGQYLITAKSDGIINVWEIHSSFEPIAIYKGNVFCLDTYWNRREGKHLFCGNENRIIHKWELKEIEVPKPLHKPLFNALMNPSGDDLVARQTLKNTIAVIRGNKNKWKMIAETKLIDGKVNTMILTPDGSKLIYDIVKEQRQEIFLLYVDTNSLSRITSLKSTSNFIKIATNFENGIAIIFQENADALKVWLEEKVCYLVTDTGDVMSIYEMENDQILTVTKNFVIKYWYVCGYNWHLGTSENYEAANSTAISSTLSAGKQFLAVLNEDQKSVVLYNIYKDRNVDPVQVSINLHHENYSYQEKITCMEFSRDEKLFAIGYESGNISILNVEEKREVRKVSFHCSPIIEMHWAPSSYKVPILMSINAEELIWWNVAPVIKEPIRRQNRMGRSISMQSVPSPRSSFKMKNSQSNESKLSIATSGTNGIDSMNVNNNNSGININGKSVNGDKINGKGVNGSNPSGSGMNGANLNASSINGSNFNASSINGSNLHASSINGSNINGTNHNGSNHNDSSINGSSINGSSINGDNNNFTNTNGKNTANGIGNGCQSSNNNGTTLQRVDSAKYFWESKVEKVDKSAMLCLVPLPSGNAKVCVSEDFNKFLTVDNNGYVSTFEPFGILDII